jgi:seryl-tRNA synthetase
VLDIELIRKDPEGVRQAMVKRGEDAPIDRVLELDERRRNVIFQRDELRSRRNQLSQEIGKRKGNAPELVEEVRGIGSRIEVLEEEVRKVEVELRDLLLVIPNIPLPDVPPGKGSEDNIVVRSWGKPRDFPFTPLPHWDLAGKLGMIDFERGAKLSGARFFVLKGAGVKLERALVAWMLDFHTKRGYQEVGLPALVRREVMVGSGNLPKFGDNLYHDEEDDLWLVPTAEVPITSLHRDEVLSADALPLKYAAYTPCFRKEKAAAGRDTRGIKRVKQFDKVEMYRIVEPSQSEVALQEMVADAEAVCQALGFPYRVLLLCAADIGFQSAMSYDLEMWAPGSNEWLEVSSCSNCLDFQARRVNLRYRPDAKARPQYVHTLNGSGLGMPRVFISVLENGQQPDGSVVIPEVLRSYTGFDIIRPPG